MLHMHSCRSFCTHTHTTCGYSAFVVTAWSINSIFRTRSKDTTITCGLSFYFTSGCQRVY